MAGNTNTISQLSLPQQLLLAKQNLDASNAKLNAYQNSTGRLPYAKVDPELLTKETQQEQAGNQIQVGGYQHQIPLIQQLDFSQKQQLANQQAALQNQMGQAQFGLNAQNTASGAMGSMGQYQGTQNIQSQLHTGLAGLSAAQFQQHLQNVGQLAQLRNQIAMGQNQYGLIGTQGEIAQQRNIRGYGTDPNFAVNNAANIAGANVGLSQAQMDYNNLYNQTQSQNSVAKAGGQLQAGNAGAAASIANQAVPPTRAVG
jgi:hypothetical protein